MTVADEPEEVSGRTSYIQNVTSVNGFAYGVIGADIHVFGNGLPLYLLANWRGSVAADPAWLKELPSRLLNAVRAVVPFTGRQEELRRLREWREQDGRLAVRWLYGEAGQGKSRLAARFAEVSAAEGWKVVAAFHGPEADQPAPGSEDLRADGAAGLLVLVDYADRWSLTGLTYLFKNTLLHQAEVPTRVLMVSRSHDPWPGVRKVLDRYQAATSSQALPALDWRSGARAEMFDAARDSFAAIHGLADSSAITAHAALDDPGLGLTLAVHMAALVAVDAHVNGLPAPADVPGLTLYLLDREQAHWARSHRGADPSDTRLSNFRTPPAAMNRIVFASALTGPLPRADAVAVLDVLDLGVPAEQALAEHSLCYPGPGSDDSVLQPLYPDRLAEDFLALTLPGHDADYPQQTWAQEAVRKLLARSPGTRRAAAYTPRALVFLVAAAQRWEHVGPRHLYPLLRDDPHLAVVAGGPLLTGLAALPDVTPAVLTAIRSCLPGSRDIDLAEGSAAVIERLAPHRLSRTRSRLARAAILSELGGRLAHAGHYQRAARAEQEAIAIVRARSVAGLAVRVSWHIRRANILDRELVRLEPLAKLLIQHATTLAEMGQAQQALAAAEEAVAFFRRRPPHVPRLYEFDLTHALGVLSRVQEQLGRADEALASAQEAVEIRRRTSREYPAFIEPGLAGLLGDTVSAERRRLELSILDPIGPEDGLASALADLGIRLATQGDLENAITATAESLRIKMSLAEDDPTLYGPHLAIELGNYSTMLAETGRHEEALDYAKIGVEGLRRPAATNPAKYGPALANALDTLSRRLADQDMLEQALVASEECAALFRDRQVDGAEARHHLGNALTHLASCLSMLDRHEEALQAVGEAVIVHREVRRPNPAAGHHRLALALSELGSIQFAAGDLAGALASREEAIRFLRPLIPQRQEYERDLADMLLGLGVLLHQASRHRDCMDVTGEALDILRRQAASHPTVCEPQIARGLTCLSGYLADAGEAGPAVTAATESVEIYRRLTDVSPAVYARHLARALDALDTALATDGHLEQALEAMSEAAGIYRGLARDHPASHEASLAMALVFVGLRCTALGRMQEALTATRESVEIHRRLAAIDPAIHLPGLARSLSNLGTGLANVGETAAALDASQQATELYRRLAEADPTAHCPDLAAELDRLSYRYARLDQPAQQAAALQESVEIHRRLAADDPEARNLYLAEALYKLGAAYYERGHQEASLETLTEAVTIGRRLAERDPTADPVPFAQALDGLSGPLLALGRAEQALTTNDRALDLYRRLHQEDPAQYAESYARVLRNRAVILNDLGRPEEADALTAHADSLG